MFRLTNAEGQIDVAVEQNGEDIEIYNKGELLVSFDTRGGDHTLTILVNELAERGIKVLVWQDGEETVFPKPKEETN